MSTNIKYVILITIDCLRSDILLSMLPKLPTFNMLAREGTFIDDMLANSVPTYLAFPMLFSSRNDLIKEDRVGYPVNHPSLIKELKKNKIMTIAFTDGNPWLSSFFGYHYYFDFFYDEITASSNLKKRVATFLKQSNTLDYLSRLVFVMLGKNLYPSSLEIIEKVRSHIINIKSKERAFLWLHLMDLHYPWFSRSYSSRIQAKTWYWFSRYSPEKSYNKDEIAIVGALGKELYQSKLIDIDNSIQKLLNLLDKEHILNSTIIMITSDHGTEFGEQGGLGHGPWKTIEEYIRIPLIVYGNVLKEKAINTKHIEQIDIAPTIAEIFQINVPKTWQGQSLFSNYIISPRFCSFQYGFNPFNDETLNNRYVILVDYMKAKYTLNDHSNYSFFENFRETKDSVSCKNELEQLAKNFLRKLKLKEKARGFTKNGTKNRKST